LDGTSINIRAVRPDIRLGDRGVPVNNELLEGFLTKKEIIANPKKIRLALVSKANPWPNTRMDEIEVATAERGRKCCEELAMIVGERLCEGVS
jgi:hypothetical protein